MESLPVEIFSQILLYATHNSRSALAFSSVCTSWHAIVSSLPFLWSNIHLFNLVAPQAADCIQSILDRSKGRFHCVFLDLTSLPDHSSHAAVTTALQAILEHATPPFWHELSITAATYQHIDFISDFLHLEAPHSLQLKLTSIKTLRLSLPSKIPPPRRHLYCLSARPRFNTCLFTKLQRIYLTNVHIQLFPDTLQQSTTHKPLEIHLDDWHDLLDGSCIASHNPAMLLNSTNAITTTAPINNFYYHLILNRSPLHTYPFEKINFFNVSALTLSSPLLQHSTTPLLRFWSHLHFPNLRYLELSDITLETWSNAVQSFRAMTTPLFPELRCIVLRVKDDGAVRKVLALADERLKGALPSLKKVVCALAEPTDAQPCEVRFS